MQNKPADPFPLPPQKCGLCGTLLIPVRTPEGNFRLWCCNPKCPKSREEFDDDDELEETS
jgi:hypothetical protein